MNEEILKEQLRKMGVTETILTDHELRFFDRSLSVVCDVRPTEELNEETVLKQVKSYVETSSRSNPPPLRLTIHFPFELVQNPDVAEFVLKLSGLYEKNLLSHLMIHSPSSPHEWEPLKVMLKTLREKLKHPRSCHVEWIAPFGEFQQGEMESLFNLGLRIRYAAGWTGSSPSSSIPEIHREVLRQLSQMGYQCPIEWYLHEENMGIAEDLLPDLLFDNFWSGFSLPLVSENPFYRFEEEYPVLPEATDYAELLVRCYQKYSCYDTVMNPLSGLIMRTREGAWHKEFNLPRTIRLNIDREGKVGLFNQVPSLAKYFDKIENLSKLRPEDLKDSFVDTVIAFGKESDTQCHECPWLMLCGGLDKLDIEFCKRTKHETLCLYRRLFLEHFVSMRTPHLRIGESEGITEEQNS